MKFTLIEDGDCEKQWFSPELNHGDWCHFFVIRLEYTDEWGDRPEYKFHISINVVSPEAVSKENIESACRSCGIDEDTWRGMTSIARSQILIYYGTYAPIWQQTGNSERKLLKEAKEKIQEIDMLFGFWMDRPLNAIGNSGWDFVAGRIGFKFEKKEEEDAENQTEGSDALQPGNLPLEHQQPEAPDGQHLAQQEKPGGDSSDILLDRDHDDPK